MVVQRISEPERVQRLAQMLAVCGQATDHPRVLAYDGKAYMNTSRGWHIVDWFLFKDACRKANRFLTRAA